MAKFHRHHTKAAKLTAEKVLEIRRLYHEENRTQASLAREFEVTDGTIGRIVRGTSWQAYGGPGQHEGAQQEQESALLHDAALQRAAIENALSADDPRILASLAKLANLGVDINSNSGKKKEGGE